MKYRIKDIVIAKSLVKCLVKNPLVYVAGNVFETWRNVVRGMCIAFNSPVHSNAVLNYIIAIRLFRTVLRNHGKNVSSNNRLEHCEKGVLLVFI